MSPKRRALPAALAVSLPVAALAVAGVLSSSTAPAYAEASGPGAIASYTAELTLDGDGVLHVQEAVTVTASGDVLTRTLQTRVREDAEEDRRYEIRNLSATVNAKPAQGLRNEEIDSGREITVKTSAGQSHVIYKYDVIGAVAESAQGLEVSWPVVQGFSTAIQRIKVTANVPFATWVACFAGQPGSNMPCTSSQLGESAALEIEQLGLPVGGRLTVLVGLSNEATVQPNADFVTRRSLSRSFTVDSTTLGLSALLLGLGALGAAALWFVRGRDAGRVPAPSGKARPVLDGESGPQFAAPDGIRPGELGTVADEAADVADITATLLDLAVRNYLTIVELPRSGEFGKLDWQLQHRHEAGPELLSYEKALLEAVFADGDTVTVSSLGTTLRPRLDSVREHLYADVVAQGWFAQRPDAVRNRWSTAGVVLMLAGAVLTVVLAVTTTFGLVGLAVILAGAALALAGQAAPARTARGSAVLGQVAGLQAYLRDESAADLPEAHRLEFASRCLPYATVLGLTEKWAQEIAGTDDDAEADAGIGWYSGPENWHLSDIGESLTNFVNAVSGSLSSSRRLFAG